MKSWAAFGTQFRDHRVASREGELIKKILLLGSALLLVAVCFPGVMCAKDEGDRARLQERLQKAGTILDQITSAPDKGIPQDILAHAECVGVIPSLMKAGFVVAGEYGQGVVTCRTKRGW